MLTLYRIFAALVYYLTFPYTYSCRLAGSRKWSNRLGYVFPKNNSHGGGKTIWLHASSMGEVKVLTILAGQIGEIDNEVDLYISVMTEAGYQRAINLMGKKASIGYMPLDHVTSIRRFLDSVRPSAAVFIETEIWPNAAMALGQRKISLFLANGRLSEKGALRYGWFRPGLKKVLANYARIMVQTEMDRQRFIHIGADNNVTEVFGSLKFDAPVHTISPKKRTELRASLPFDSRTRILIAGSTRQSENDILLDVYKRLQAEFSDLRLILVPRHLDAVEQICRKTEELNLNYRFYTKPGDSGGECFVLIVDKMGILNDLYAVSDIAFVGGTLVDIGGHNILEPVWAGIPVLYGPSIFNVKDSSEYVIENNFGESVPDAEALYVKLRLYLSGGSNYCRRSPNSDEPSRAYRTARIILDSIHKNGKDLANHINP